MSYVTEFLESHGGEASQQSEHWTMESHQESPRYGTFSTSGIRFGSIRQRFRLRVLNKCLGCEIRAPRQRNGDVCRDVANKLVIGFRHQ